LETKKKEESSRKKKYFYSFEMEALMDGFDNDVEESFVTSFPKELVPNFLPFWLEEEASDTTDLANRLLLWSNQSRIDTDLPEKIQFGLRCYVGEHLLKKISKLDQARHERENVRAKLAQEVATTEKELAKKTSEKAPQEVLAQLKQKIQWLELNRTFDGLYPGYLRMSGQEFNQSATRIASKLLDLAVELPRKLFKDSEIASKERSNSERRLRHVINVVLRYVEPPEELLVLTQKISSITAGNDFRPDFLTAILLDVAQRTKYVVLLHLHQLNS